MEIHRCIINLPLRCRYEKPRKSNMQANITVISASEARKEASKRIADYIQGNDPMAAKKAAQALTFEEFVRERYAPWVKSQQKRPEETLRLLALFYPYFGNRKLAEIDAWVIERYRTARLKEAKPISVNHDFTALRAALNRAIAWDLLKDHPMRTVKQSGELFNLKWEDVNFAEGILTVIGETAKSGKTRHIVSALMMAYLWHIILSRLKT